jgi:hypothetical protein
MSDFPLGCLPAGSYGLLVEGREKIPKGGITPLWQRGVGGDFPMPMLI